VVTLKDVQKDFDNWNIKKKKLQTSVFHAFVHRREVWWCSLGLNIGFEEDGKNELFERPVLILKKFNNDVVLVIPITSQVKQNKYHICFQHQNKNYSVVISQIRLIRTKRLQRYMYRISDEATFKQIREAVGSMI